MDEPNHPAPSAPAPRPAVDPHSLGMAMLNNTIAAQVNLLISLPVPVPATTIINLFCEHLCKLLSLIEPEELRNSILTELRGNLPMVLQRHVTERMKTPGGVLLPPGARMQ